MTTTNNDRADWRDPIRRLLRAAWIDGNQHGLDGWDGDDHPDADPYAVSLREQWLNQHCPPGSAQCCEWHNQNCEPPSELCCDKCTEACHGMHQHDTGGIVGSHHDGSKCVLEAGL